MQRISSGKRATPYPLSLDDSLTRWEDRLRLEQINSELQGAACDASSCAQAFSTHDKRNRAATLFIQKNRLDDMQSHTAHVLSSPRVHYPYLPFFPQAARVVGTCPSFGTDHAQVESENGNQVVLPTRFPGTSKASCNEAPSKRYSKVIGRTALECLPIL